MPAAINYARIVASIYLFILGGLLAIVGYWPLTPIFAPGFLLSGLIVWLGAALFILQSPIAYLFARFLRPGLFFFWWAFSLHMLYISYYHHPEPSPWPEMIFNSAVCLVVALLLLPLLLVPTRLQE
jgi:hypothetical protein